MMEHNCGITDADAIASYYRKHCLEFYILLGEVPSLTNRLSASTIRTVMMLPDKDELEKFFLEYFSKVKLYITEQINYNKERIDSREGDIKNTIGFDGLALNASFKRGECRRSVKGADAVILFDCTNRVVLDYAVADKKNNERKAILSLFSARIKDSVVMSDALNAQKCVPMLFEKWS